MVSTESDEGFDRLMTLGGNLLREGLRCAVTAISLELIAQVNAQRFDGTLYRSSPFTKLLTQALEDVILLSAKQIQRCETNIKLHMFLGMVLALVEAIESGASLEHKIAKATKDSLEFCHGLLQMMSETVSLPSSDETALGSPNFDNGLEAWDLDWDLKIFLPDAPIFQGVGQLVSSSFALWVRSASCYFVAIVSTHPTSLFLSPLPCLDSHPGAAIKLS